LPLRSAVKQLCAAALVLAVALAAAQPALAPEVAAAIDSISANALRAHVSCLASDLLEGRATPSRGAEIAAEYIAAQFRRAGLEPAAGGSYFQDGRITPPRRSPNAPAPEPVAVRNVIGALPGSDPDLAGTCVIVSAHYDHLGQRQGAEGDTIYNGANDDASGVSAVIEIAQALAPLRSAPKRTILFIAFAGEERGRLGSRFYVEHPVCPIDKTAAGINLEQLGRTDDVSGPVTGTAYVTGFDYSDVGPLLQQAGERAGVRLLKHEPNSDKFFTGSDNLSLALAGVPAHTISVGFIFPDYHRPGDHWDKLDYDNMARVVRGIALGVYELANRTAPVRWNDANPLAERYRIARAAAQGAP
jgi:hypothetical protein